MPINGLKRELMALLMPIECLGCKAESDWICAGCLRDLQLHREDLCFCGKVGVDGLCNKHRDKLGLDGLTTLFSYTEPSIRELIHQIKYRGHTDAVTFFAQKYQKKVLARLPRGEWVVTTVPLSRGHQRQRGFNQSTLLARKLTEPVYDYVDLLIKKWETKPQVKLNKTQREKNLVRSFAFKSRCVVPEQVVLVDDVVTTGSTLKEAAKVLRKAGVQKVWGLTIAHG
ncbi:MAG: phosphoribosyltransferase family protein [Patescibacteria group bacterium]